MRRNLPLFALLGLSFSLLLLPTAFGDLADVDADADSGSEQELDKMDLDEDLVEDESTQKKDPSNGLGDHVAWTTLKEGWTKAEEERKPLMLIIHKSWCGACKAIKPQIKESKEFGEWSKNFVMVNTMDDEEPREEMYKPDGGYVPRMLFFKPNGEFLEDVINESGNPHYKYYYFDVDALITSMKKVAEMFKTKAASGQKEKVKSEL